MGMHAPIGIHKTCHTGKNDSLEAVVRKKGWMISYTFMRSLNANYMHACSMSESNGPPRSGYQLILIVLEITS